MINRRKFLEAGAAAGVGAMLPVKIAAAAEKASRMGAGTAAAPTAVGVSPALAKYVQTIPAPQFFASTGLNRQMGALHYDVAACAFTHKFHPDLPPTPVWGYQPVDAKGNPIINFLYSHHILANVNVPIEIQYINALLPTDIHPVEIEPSQRGVTIDRANIDGMIDPATGAFWPDQRIATHKHGGHVPWTSDGGPRAWYTGPYFAKTPSGGVFGPGKSVLTDGLFNGTTYYYPNNQAAAQLWFHDHAMGITRLNVIAGLAAFYLLENPAANALLNAPGFNLPIGIPLVIQDRIFNASGTFYYPPAPEIPEFFGDTIVVNGKVWPRMDLTPGQYRLRLLNGCNARFLRMQFVVAPGGSLPSVRSWKNLPFTQIGAEGGLFPAPAPSPSSNVLVMAPAERADLVVDFSKLAPGSTVILYNDASTPYHGSPDTRGAIPEIMMFNIVSGASPAPIVLNQDAFNAYGGFKDQNGSAANAPDPASATPAVKVLTEITLPNGMLEQLITSRYGTGYAVAAPGDKGDQVTLGTTELWQIVNTTVDTHPIHMHQSMFKTIGRYNINTSAYVKAAAAAGGGVNAVDPTPFIVGGLIPPAFNEVGWKDTIQANPGQISVLAVKWVDYTGNYVYHCHILEHEEHDMMRALVINSAV